MSSLAPQLRTTAALLLTHTGRKCPALFNHSWLMSRLQTAADQGRWRKHSDIHPHRSTDTGLVAVTLKNLMIKEFFSTQGNIQIQNCPFWCVSLHSPSQKGTGNHGSMESIGRLNDVGGWHEWREQKFFAEKANDSGYSTRTVIGGSFGPCQKEPGAMI